MYDTLADYYHLIFENWDASIARQAAVLGPLIENAYGRRMLRVLDAACGIGTQAIGLAGRDQVVTGSDLSRGAIRTLAPRQPPAGLRFRSMLPTCGISRPFPAHRSTRS